ncbi:intracellular sulfur oxidation protein [Coprothermobacteraceae bacterium]|nr:intracellular sulfur oxidation protein [Coprothermobacteraceae bacterium]
MRKVLFAVYQAPVGSIWVNEAFRCIFGMYAEDLEPAVLLTRDAVITVNKNLRPERIGLLPLSTVFRYLERYGTKVYVNKDCLEWRGLSENDVDPRWHAELISDAEVGKLLHEYDFVLWL